MKLLRVLATILVVCLVVVGARVASQMTGSRVSHRSEPTGLSNTVASGINPQGDIVGTYLDSAGASHGFLLRQGKYTTIDVPEGVQGTAVFGINPQGDIVGWYYSDIAGTPHGFLGRGGSYTTVDVPA